MNAAVLLAASIVVALTPVAVSSPLLLSEAVILAVGLSAMLVATIVLTRRALVPPSRLSDLMARVDLLAPGERIPVSREAREVVRLPQSIHAMLDRLEVERRETARHAMRAQEAERRRVARELHDAVGRSLAVAPTQLDPRPAARPREVARASRRRRRRFGPASRTRVGSSRSCARRRSTTSVCAVRSSRSPRGWRTPPVS